MSRINDELWLHPHNFVLVFKCITVAGKAAGTCFRFKTAGFAFFSIDGKSRHLKTMTKSPVAAS